MLWQADDIADVVIADVSAPMNGAIDARMWATYGTEAPRGRKQWMRSAKTLAALEPQQPGERHPAALAIVCACRWAGWDIEATKQKLRVWSATCVDDGRFPRSTANYDELDALADWAQRRLRPGGPTAPPTQQHGHMRSPKQWFPVGLTAKTCRRETIDPRDNGCCQHDYGVSIVVDSAGSQPSAEANLKRVAICRACLGNGGRRRLAPDNNQTCT